MASDIDIANMALGLLGQDSISDLTDNNDSARVINRFLRPTVDSVLRSYPWACATFRATLNQEATGPAFGWLYSYTLPTSPYCLRVLTLNNDESVMDLRGATFVVEGRRLLTNETTAEIRYIGRITDSGQYDASLLTAIYHRLAAAACMSLTRNASLAAELSQAARALTIEARVADGQEGMADIPYYSPLRAAHRGF